MFGFGFGRPFFRPFRRFGFGLPFALGALTGAFLTPPFFRPFPYYYQPYPFFY